MFAYRAADGTRYDVFDYLLIRLLNRRMQKEHRLAGADRSSIFFLKVKGLSFSITKEGGCGGVGVGTGDGLGKRRDIGERGAKYEPAIGAYQIKATRPARSYR
ncbi:hypothetical protein DPMN_162012 [Dreissena polymorpha]|uniref:Uncharacterized protein n=1 Tax=Dreissena polymorpha TaxID=45954 RepID=A0A9D4ET75_DREPO|nr:hypothetical protein DPMN_162012 [Dreissena polymorpha]